MCGGHRKRPATEDEDEVIGANNNPDSPYGVFLSSLRPPKAKSAAALLQDAKMGEPVLVYTGTKPPAPGSLAAGDAKKKTVAAKPPAGKDAAKDTAKDGRSRQEWHRDRRRPVRRGDRSEAEAKAQGPGGHGHVQGRRFHRNRRRDRGEAETQAGAEGHGKGWRDADSRRGSRRRWSDAEAKTQEAGAEARRDGSHPGGASKRRKPSRRDEPAGATALQPFESPHLPLPRKTGGARFS